MTAPAGAVVRIYVDLVARVLVGDVIETQTGRRYRVLGVRVQKRGRRRGRQHLSCVVLDNVEQLVDGATLHRIRWYPRGRRSA